MEILRVENLTKVYGKGENEVRALDGVSFSVEKGEFVAVIGPSGSGKSTLLHILGGVDRPTGGKVFMDGKDVYAQNEEQLAIFRRRQVGLIYQFYNLIPVLNVTENITLPVLMDGQKVNQNRLAELMTTLKLTGRENHLPNQLSGGQQQRVALARALVIEPSVLLFDEPLSNLDAKLRVSMRTEIRRIQQRVGITAIYVTHDQSEAMALSDQIIVMKNGVVEQMGTPQEIYYHPKNEFVADFIGEANFLRGTMTGRENGHAVIRVEGHDMPVADRPDMEPGREYTIVLRPEAAHLSDEGGVPCRVSLSCFMGSYQNYHVQLGDIRIALTEYNPQNKRIYNVGEECRLVFEPDEVHVL